ncbi:unnamed protein product [Candidula unifasciata]|uniref:2-(3-amino-3-carboxypropyl)histidine synthase subunit 2 n=1 Tax=Candidula unifasciata TaxID=100452 RepID=A0A8S3Z816_9EUPU|nr:unnamed protein product [Candidula unifasciata]
MSVTVFNSGEEVIQRKIECVPQALQTDNVDDVYEINKSVVWITQGGFKRVALQFPDELLVDAAYVAARIQEKVEDALVFILGDTSYGSCCVDEISAQHYKADCIIHFGRSCLSPTGRLPVLYIFGKSNIIVDDCVHQLAEVCSDTYMKAVLVYDTVYSHAIDEIFSKLRCIFKHLILSELAVPKHLLTSTTSQGSEVSDIVTSPVADDIVVNHTSQATSSSKSQPASSFISKYGRTIEIPITEDIDSYSFIFIGDTEGSSLTNLMMTFNRCPFYSYNPLNMKSRKETLNVNKALMKRYYLIERAKDANIVGIVVGTLGVASYRNVIEHLKLLLKKAGKKSYTFVVGKLNPAKLANFAEVDIYVLVACPESTLLDQSDFYRPIVSPLEMEIACNQAREWTGEYSTDFRDILPGASLHVENADTGEGDNIRTDVSLISNRVRALGVKETTGVSSVSSQDLLLRSESLAVASLAENAGEFLASRSWKGLERKLGETPVIKAAEGQFGIAAGYQHELADV